MRKLLVSNFITLDGYYESKDKTFHRFFEYFLDEYGTNEAFDVYNRDLLRGADTLILSGRTSFIGNKRYWTSVPDDPKATETRREFARLIANIDKVVVSDTITAADLAPWEGTTRILRGLEVFKGDRGAQRDARSGHRGPDEPPAVERDAGPRTD